MPVSVGHRVPPECLGCRAPKVIQELRAPPEIGGTQASRVYQELLENLAQMERPERTQKMDRMVYQEKMVHLDHRDLLAMLGLWGLKVNLGLRAEREPWG